MKSLNASNWLAPDPAWSPEPRPAQWRDDFVAIALGPQVPAEVAGLFESARASLVYGVFYAPLVAVGVEQCYWALEAGLRARCARQDLPVSVQDRQGKDHALSFSHNLRQLQDQGLIAEADAPLWRQAGELKDWVASPRLGGALGREHAVIALGRAAELLNRLFA
ncbi:MAG: hypothetical protein AB1421_07585 [Pseudomonadota bacterium]